MGNTQALQPPHNQLEVCLIPIVSRVFANAPGDRGSILGRVIPKTQKVVFDASLLNTKHFKVQIKDIWSNQGKGVVPSPAPQVLRLKANRQEDLEAFELQNDQVGWGCAIHRLHLSCLTFKPSANKRLMLHRIAWNRRV